MNSERLLQRIRLGEDSTLELKQVKVGAGGKSFEPHADGLSDELAALGNASGGTLILGVDDSTKQEVPGADLKDLNPLLVDRFMVDGEGDAAIQLERLHLLKPSDDGPRPTVAGVLLCTLAPQRWLRNAEIIAVAHDGFVNDPNEQVDALEIQGPLDRQIWDALHFVRRNMRTPARKSLVRIDYPQYDLAAVFEAIVNAVAHRDYSRDAQRIRLFMYADRLEIHTPGAPRFREANSMTIASMTAISAPRNEVIASLFARYYPVEEPLLGKGRLMDRRGAGVRLILERSAALSGKRPVYENLDDMELLLTIYAAAPPATSTTMNV